MRLRSWAHRLILALALAGLGASAMACGGSPAASDAEPAAGAPAGEEAGEADEEADDALAAGPVGDPEKGQTRFAPCAGCHGPDATGIEGLGKNLRTSEFLKGLSDAEAVAFLKVGRPASDPLNTTGVDMPPKGGDPTLDDQGLADVVAYLRTLQ